MKTCARCKIVKQPTDYYKGNQSYCITCTKEYSKDWHKLTYVPHPKVYKQPPHLKPSREHTKLELAWLAGFYEGDGSLDSHGYIQIAQKTRWPLDFVRARFGGRVTRYKVNKNKWRSKSAYYFKWSLTGPPCRELLQKLFPYLSPRRKEQVEKYSKPIGDDLSV